MAEPEKKCPKCQEKVKLLASVCKHCGYQFSQAEMAEAKKQDELGNKIGGGCAVVVVVILLLAFCGKNDDSPTSSSATSSASAEDRQKGFHCLSGWDGSNRSLVQQVKSQLRDPDSFEHDETRITPNNNGSHTVSMRYRARNGFGGMNVATAIGTVSHYSCDATLISTGE